MGHLKVNSGYVRDGEGHFLEANNTAESAELHPNLLFIFFVLNMRTLSACSCPTSPDFPDNYKLEEDLGNLQQSIESLYPQLDKVDQSILRARADLLRGQQKLLYNIKVLGFKIDDVQQKVKVIFSLLFIFFAYNIH